MDSTGDLLQLTKNIPEGVKQPQKRSRAACEKKWRASKNNPQITPRIKYQQ